MMQDTVLTVVKKRYFEFKDYLFISVPKKVQVVNACEVVNYYVSDDEKENLSEEEIKRLEKRRTVEPLFFVDLVKSKDD